MFGGPNLNILYVTSMAKPLLPRFPGDGVPRGSLFAIHDPGIQGVPEPRFADQPAGQVPFEPEVRCARLVRGRRKPRDPRRSYTWRLI